MVRKLKGVARFSPGVKKKKNVPCMKLSLGVKIPVEADVIKSIIRSYRQTVNICWKVKNKIKLRTSSIRI